MGCDIHIITEIKKNNKWKRVPETPEEFNCRNYSVFAFLANVRNSFDTQGFKPKGLPEDISALHFDRCEEIDDWDIDFECPDYHSHSYLTLKELQDKDKTDLQMIKCKVVKAFIDKFVECGGKIPDEIIVSEREPETFSFFEVLHEAAEPTVIVKWNTNKTEHAVFKGIKELENIADKYNVQPDDIRIVFAFDN